MPETQTVNVNMTWSGNLNLLLACLQCSSDEAKQTATDELRRMAELADLYVESQQASGTDRGRRSETIRRVS